MAKEVVAINIEVILVPLLERELLLPSFRSSRSSRMSPCLRRTALGAKQLLVHSYKGVLCFPLQIVAFCNGKCIILQSKTCRSRLAKKI